MVRLVEELKLLGRWMLVATLQLMLSEIRKIVQEGENAMQRISSRRSVSPLYEVVMNATPYRFLTQEAKVPSLLLIHERRNSTTSSWLEAVP